VITGHITFSLSASISFQNGRINDKTNTIKEQIIKDGCKFLSPSMCHGSEDPSKKIPGDIYL
jgi:hypothetical protein